MIKGTGKLGFDIEATGNWATNFFSDQGNLLAITDPALGEVMWTLPQTEGGRPGANNIIDTLRLTGVPCLWNRSDFHAFF